MRVDTHAHYFPPEYPALLERYGSPNATRGATAPPGTGLEERLELLDELAIDLQVLSVGALTPYLPDAGQAAAAARLANDLYSAACEQSGGRYAAFATLPLPHLDAALVELDRTLALPGVLGVTLGCSISGQALDDPAFHPVFDEFDRRAVVLFLHPVGAGAAGPLLDGPGLRPLLALPFEDTVAAVRLALSGWIARYPNIRVLVPHLGGMLPFLFGRFAYTLDALAAHPPRGWQPRPDLVDQLRTLWFDTVSNHPPALRCARDTLGADRLVLGSDYPFLVGDHFRRCVQYVRDAGLADAEAEGVLDRNAARLLRL